MSLPNNRRRAPGGLDSQSILLLSALVILVLTLAGVWVGVWGGRALDGTTTDITSDPWVLALQVFTGQVPFPASSWVVLGTVLTVALVLAGGIVLAVTKRRRRRTRVDRAASYMGVGRDIEEISEKTARQKAKRLGVMASPGVPIGRTVRGGHPLFGSWEDMHVDIWGTRTGKSTSRAIPAIMTAPGAVMVTSNKRDVVDATRDPRSKAGPVWVFDPQGIANEEPTWWWNPLSYVTDEVKASKMADHFASGSRDPGARTDAFFDPAGQDLLAGLLLAAAVDGRPITDVYTWLTRPTDDTPVDILRRGGFPLTADQVAGVVDAPDKQRGGIYGTAQQMASCLTNRQVSAWVTPGSGWSERRPQFSPESFVRDGGTLYSLSKEGRGTAGPLVTALTVAVVEAAEELATRSAGGRLSTPLLGVLDEAANVCRWRELPNLYSHYGSRGIVLMTILQSWSQGVDVWGESGMKKLWSASNIKTYGGGVSETSFLEDLSKLIGDYDRISTSASVGRDQRNVSTQLQRESILTVAELGAMPKGRALVIASGSRPTLVATQPWMTAAYASEVRASIAAHDPLAQKTLHEADNELLAVRRELGA